MNQWCQWRGEMPESGPAFLTCLVTGNAMA
jgi:hypothetical protein